MRNIIKNSLVALFFSVLIVPSVMASQNNFHYQLQKTNYSKLKQLKNSYIVIDIDDSELTKQQIESLKNNWNIVLSYLSIWEAEDYRDYWQKWWKVWNPEFLDKENRDWPGNYKVKYWNSDWQDIIINKAEKIKETWYDWVYLDIIDAYYYYEEKGRETAAFEMIDFVKKIKDKTKFLVFWQNALDLVDYPEYLDTIDWVWVEDLLTNGNKKQNNTEIEYRENFLNKVIEADKKVLSVDYATKNNLICNYYNYTEEKWYISSVFNRNLSISSAKKCVNNNNSDFSQKTEKEKRQEYYVERKRAYEKYKEDLAEITQEYQDDVIELNEKQQLEKEQLADRQKLERSEIKEKQNKKKEELQKALASFLSELKNKYFWK